jgi:uncharacterized protein YbaR (Trm112 family)
LANSHLKYKSYLEIVDVILRRDDVWVVVLSHVARSNMALLPFLLCGSACAWPVGIEQDEGDTLINANLHYHFVSLEGGYPIRDDIPIMLIDEAICRDKGDQ